MKIRLGFVSNSSSSSYVCDICGEIESGWDMSPSDANMVQCVNGHVFHEECAKEQGIDLTGMYDDEDNYPYEIPENYCPFCRMENVIQTDVMSYLLKKCGLKYSEAKAEIAKRFKTYGEFTGFLKGDE